MIKIEYLFPEMTNLYGDIFNVKYLKSCLEEAEIIETSITEDPKFINQENQKIDLVYMGTMSEKAQEIVIKKLEPYKDKIKNAIDNNQIILLTGNALEVFGKYIEDENGNKIEGLGLIDTYAKKDLNHRYNTLFLGEFDIENTDTNKDNEQKNEEQEKDEKEKMKIMGFKSTFSFSYGDNKESYMFKSIKGCGINKESTLEGIRINNLFGTYLLGPLLIVNPEFTKYIMKLLGIENPVLKHEKEIYECYNERLEEFEKESTNYLQ